MLLSKHSFILVQKNTISIIFSTSYLYNLIHTPNDMIVDFIMILFVQKFKYIVVKSANVSCFDK